VAQAVPDVVVRIEKARLYRGRGGEVIRSAVSRLIECAAEARFPLDGPVIVRLQARPSRGVAAQLGSDDRAQAALDDNLRHSSEEITVTAAAAMRALGSGYFHLAADPIHKSVLKYIGGVHGDPLPGVRRGCGLALGALPPAFAAAHLEPLLQQLVLATQLEVRVRRMGRRVHVGADRVRGGGRTTRSGAMPRLAATPSLRWRPSRCR
jgi:hypothetical protein